MRATLSKTKRRHFFTHFCIKLKNHIIFSKFDYLTGKNVSIPIRNTIGLVCKINSIMYKIEFLGQIDLFHQIFFKLENHISTKKITLFVPWDIIHMSILNDISCNQSYKWSIRATVCSACKNTIAKAELST